MLISFLESHRLINFTNLHVMIKYCYLFEIYGKKVIVCNLFLPIFLFCSHDCHLYEGRRGIEPKTGLNPFLKYLLNVFCMHKTDFFS